MLRSIIEANRRRTLILIASMLLLFTVGGAGLGVYLSGSPFQGILIGLVIGGIYFIVSYYGGSSIILRMSGAHEIVEKSQAPMLFNVVEEMAIASGLKRIPRIFVIDESAPNAFATGRNHKEASVAVTTGLLRICTRDELQGVIAHELAHVNNYDIRYMILLSVMVGSIALLADVLRRSMFYGSRSRCGSRKLGKEGAVFLLLLLVFVIVGPFVARVIYFAASRRREYLADACGALYTRFPQGLASALQKISVSNERWQNFPRAARPLLIAPLPFFGTHPPTSERIKILLRIGGSGNLSIGTYQTAFQEITRSRSPLVRPSDDYFMKKELGIRSEDFEGQKSTKASAVQALDAIRIAAGFSIFSCNCGVRLKIPRLKQTKTFRCPKCMAKHTINGDAVPARAI